MKLYRVLLFHWLYLVYNQQCTASSSSAAAAASCDAAQGWVQASGRQCLLIGKSRTNWTEARLSCKNMGSDLASFPGSLHDQVLLDKLSVASPYWVGYRYSQTNPGWLSGSPRLDSARFVTASTTSDQYQCGSVVVSGNGTHSFLKWRLGVCTIRAYLFVCMLDLPDPDALAIIPSSLMVPILRNVQRSKRNRSNTSRTKVRCPICYPKGVRFSVAAKLSRRQDIFGMQKAHSAHKRIANTATQRSLRQSHYLNADAASSPDITKLSILLLGSASHASGMRRPLKAHNGDLHANKALLFESRAKHRDAPRRAKDQTSSYVRINARVVSPLRQATRRDAISTGRVVSPMRKATMRAKQQTVLGKLTGSTPRKSTTRTQRNARTNESAVSPSLTAAMRTQRHARTHERAFDVPPRVVPAVMAQRADQGQTATRLDLDRRGRVVRPAAPQARPNNLDLDKRGRVIRPASQARPNNLDLDKRGRVIRPASQALPNNLDHVKRGRVGRPASQTRPNNLDLDKRGHVISSSSEEHPYNLDRDTERRRIGRSASQEQPPRVPHPSGDVLYDGWGDWQAPDPPGPYPSGPHAPDPHPPGPHAPGPHPDHRHSGEQADCCGPPHPGRHCHSHDADLCSSPPSTRASVVNSFLAILSLTSPPRAFSAARTSAFASFTTQQTGKPKVTLKIAESSSNPSARLSSPASPQGVTRLPLLTRSSTAAAASSAKSSQRDHVSHSSAATPLTSPGTFILPDTSTAAATTSPAPASSTRSLPGLSSPPTTATAAATASPKSTAYTILMSTVVPTPKSTVVPKPKSTATTTSDSTLAVTSPGPPTLTWSRATVGATIVVTMPTISVATVVKSSVATIPKSSATVVTLAKSSVAPTSQGSTVLGSTPVASGGGYLVPATHAVPTLPSSTTTVNPPTTPTVPTALPSSSTNVGSSKHSPAVPLTTSSMTTTLNGQHGQGTVTSSPASAANGSHGNGNPSSDQPKVTSAWPLLMGEKTSLGEVVGFLTGAKCHHSEDCITLVLLHPSLSPDIKIDLIMSRPIYDPGMTLTPGNNWRHGIEIFFRVLNNHLVGANEGRYDSTHTNLGQTLVALERFLDRVMARDQQQNSTMSGYFSHLEFQIEQLDRKVDIGQFQYADKGDVCNISNVSFQRPTRATSRPAKVVLATVVMRVPYTDVPLKSGTANDRGVIRSPVLMFSGYVDGHPRSLQHSFRLRQKTQVGHFNNSQYASRCIFLAGSMWSTHGCEVVKSTARGLNGKLDDADDDETTRHSVGCRCNHTSNFAILMQVVPFNMSEVHRMALSIITYVGCSITLITQFMAITVFTCIGSLNCERVCVHRNLCIAIVGAQVTFLAGIEAVQYRILCAMVAVLLHYCYTAVFVWMLLEGVHLYLKILCAMVAVLLHYCYTAVFVWMLLEGVHLYLKVVRVFGTERARINYYVCFGWGVPLILVIISAAADWEGYGTSSSCWLSIKRNTIWAFVGPALAIIIVNLVILASVVKIVTASAKHDRHRALDQVRAGVKAALLLLPLLGLTWVFGLAAVNQDLIIFQYLFAISNSLQGFFIFLFHCVFNTEVRQALRRLQEKRSLQRGDLSSLAGFSTSPSVSPSPSLQDQKKPIGGGESPVEEVSVSGLQYCKTSTTSTANRVFPARYSSATTTTTNILSNTVPAPATHAARDRRPYNQHNTRRKTEEMSLMFI